MGTFTCQILRVQSLSDLAEFSKEVTLRLPKEITLGRNHLRQNLNHQMVPFNTIAGQLISCRRTKLERFN